MFVAMSTRESTDKKVANFNYLKMHSLSIGSVVLTEQRERDSKNDQSYFTVLDSVTTKFQVKLNKESMYIKWEKPDLNQQVKHMNLTNKDLNHGAA